jgi:hypothetical protein
VCLAVCTTATVACLPAVLLNVELWFNTCWAHHPVNTPVSARLHAAAGVVCV